MEDNKGFIYEAKACNIKAENAEILQGKDCYYAIIKDVPIGGDENVTKNLKLPIVKVDKEIKSAIWLDTEEEITMLNRNTFTVQPFDYGYSYSVRIAKINF